MSHVACAEPTTAPAGYHEVTSLEDVSFKELTDRHAWLLNAIGAVRPDSDHPGVRAAALALVAVLTELHSRATRYAASRDHPYRCACGFSAIGLAAFEEHFDRYPPEGPNSGHIEVTEDYAAERAANG